MRIGILPAPNSGLRTMDAAGQLSRLTRHYTAYRTAGHDLSYFTCLPNDPDWIADMIRPSAPPSPQNGTRRALLRPLRQPRAFKACRVLRATSLSGALSAMTARMVWGIPFVVSHGARYAEIATLHGRPAWKWNTLRRMAFGMASAVIVPNPVQASELQAAFPHSRIESIPNWVDLAMFRPVERGERQGRPVVLYVGRLVVEKNLERLARACLEINAQLVCVGEGPLMADLRKLGAECPGAVPWEKLPDWFHSADVFCLPSYTEGHPKALIEAMACGMPCAVSKTITGVVTPGVNALTFYPEDEEGMARVLRTLLEDVRLATAMGAAARVAAFAYEMEAVLPREIAVVESVA